MTPACHLGSPPSTSWSALRRARSRGVLGHVPWASDPDPLLPPQGHLHDRYGQLVNVYTKLLLTKVSFHLKVVSSGGPWSWRDPERFPLSCPGTQRGRVLFCPDLDPRGHGASRTAWRPGPLRRFPQTPRWSGPGPGPGRTSASGPSQPLLGQYQSRRWLRRPGLSSLLPSLRS